MIIARILKKMGFGLAVFKWAMSMTIRQEMFVTCLPGHGISGSFILGRVSCNIMIFMQKQKKHRKKRRDRIIQKGAWHIYIYIYIVYRVER